MTEGNSKEFEMAVGTSNVLDSTGMMEGANYYSPLETTESEASVHSTWGGARIDMGQLCRSCASSSDYLIPIYEGEGLEHQLEFKIQKHLPIQVSVSDTLPVQLCYQCASTLIAWDSMITSCIEADKKLRAMQEAAVLESKTTEIFEESQRHIEEQQQEHEQEQEQEEVGDDNMDDMAEDSDDEPLIKTKAACEKNRATPIKKKILSKAKIKTTPVKNKTATNSKDDEVDEEERQRIALGEGVKLDVLLECELNDINKAITGGRRKYYKSRRKRICNEDWVKGQSRKIKRKEGNEEREADLAGLIDENDIDSIIQEANLLRGVKIISGDGLKGTGSTPYLECPFCQKVIEKSSMSDHLSTEHNLVAKKIQRSAKCHVCEKTFANKSFLIRHIRRVHEKVIKAKCHVCGKTFTDTSNYKQHLLIHTGVKSYMCQICGKGFVQRQGLRMHMPSHSEDYPYSCSQCSKQFRRKQHYELHLIKHTGKKSHQCETCGKFFTVKNELKMHSWIHKEEWPYVCHHCNKGFNQSCGLRVHLKNHHALGS